jgi:drug/metabolite transporter (DMT)-like permease
VDGPAPQPKTPSAHDELWGGIHMVVSCVLFACGFAIVKHLTFDLPEPVITLFRSFFAACCYLPSIIRRGPGMLATKRLPGHIWRAIVGLGSFILLVYALRRITLGDAIALSFTTPLWSMLFGVVILRERPSLRLCLTVAAGFGGVLLVAQPSAEGLGLGAVLALSSALLSSVAVMTIKQLVSTEPPYRVAFYFMSFAALFSAVIAAFDWKTPALHNWPWLVGCGVIFYLAQNGLTRAYFLGTFTRIAPLDFARLPASVAMGFLWFDEIPNALALAGMVLILGAAFDILIGGRKSRR